MPNQSISGTGLATATNNTYFARDANNNNAFSNDTIGNILRVSAGGGFLAGSYTINGYYPNINLGDGGNFNYVTLNAPLPAGASNGNYTYEVGEHAINGKYGTNLSGSYVMPGGVATWYDPESPFTDDIVGRQITVSGGTGITAAVYMAVDGYDNIDDIAGQKRKVVVLKTIDKSDTGTGTTWQHDPGTAGTGYGATWLVTGGFPLPPLFPNSLFTGHVTMARFGDSTTEGTQSRFVAELTAYYPNAASITCLGHGHNGARTEQFLPGESYYNALVADVNGAARKPKVLLGRLGTNNTLSPVSTPSQMQGWQQQISDGLLADTGVRVLWQDPLYCFEAGRDVDKLPLYRAVLKNITGVHIGDLRTYHYFETNYGFLPDRVHPNDTGATALARMDIVSASRFIEGVGEDSGSSGGGGSGSGGIFHPTLSIGG